MRLRRVAAIVGGSSALAITAFAVRDGLQPDDVKTNSQVSPKLIFLNKILPVLKKNNSRIPIIQAMIRACRTFGVATATTADYKSTFMLSNFYAWSKNKDAKQSQEEALAAYKLTDEYKAALNACHERCGKRLLWLCRKNAGMYIKVESLCTISIIHNLLIALSLCFVGGTTHCIPSSSHSIRNHGPNGHAE
jgi:hypothetical protein